MARTKPTVRDLDIAAVLRRHRRDEEIRSAIAALLCDLEPAREGFECASDYADRANAAQDIALIMLALAQGYGLLSRRSRRRG